MKNKGKYYQDFLIRYSDYRDPEFSGRYLPYRFIEKSLTRAAKNFPVLNIGTSVLGEPIEALTIGEGNIKILAWSQMHGNETTTTKAIFDIINAFILFPKDPLLLYLKKHVTLRVIPMLNPDGAFLFTRENANKVDLNRDALNRKERESIFLRTEFENFQPDFCFNLHDQRTIFSVGNSPFPATLSFLTPAMDESRELTPSRLISMKVIAAMEEDLQVSIPDQIGRYEDTFNPNCTGDTFQALNIPTILFEAGHYPGDYHREKTRELLAHALFAGLYSIATGSYERFSSDDYFRIPENQKLFYDVILRKAKHQGHLVDIAIQFKETLKNEEILFVPYVEKIAPSLAFYGLKEVKCDGKEIKTSGSANLSENDIVDELLLNNEVLVINY